MHTHTYVVKGFPQSTKLSIFLFFFKIPHM